MDSTNSASKIFRKKKSQSIWEDMHRLYLNTMPFYMRALSILGFRGFWNNSPVDTEGQL